MAIAPGAWWRRNRVSIIFPVIFFGAIYVDWNHTMEYKKKKAVLANRLAEDLKE
jgi:hypothetical protein